MKRHLIVALSVALGVALGNYGDYVDYDMVTN